MPKLIEIERKAAAIGFLRADPPFQTRVVQGCSISQSAITQWINKDRLVYIDLKRPGALDEWKRFQARFLRKYGVNVGKSDLQAVEEEIDARKPCPLCGHEHAQVAEAGPGVAAESAEGCGGAERVTIGPLSPGERAERLLRLLLTNADMVIAAANRQGGVMTKPQADTLLTMLRLAERLEPLMAENAREAAIRSDDEVAEIYDRLERRVEQRACTLAAASIRKLAQDCGNCGQRVTDPDAAARLLWARAKACGGQAAV